MSNMRRIPGGQQRGDWGDPSTQYSAKRPSAYDYVYDEPAKGKAGVIVWLKRKWWIPTIVVVVIIAIAIGVGVQQAKANAYPDYSKLSYSLSDTYSGTGFFDNFDYFATYDPAQGLVHYADRDAAAALNLTYATESSAIVRVDTRENVDATTGRISVRLESKKQYNNGLFVFDVAHTPFQCSTWPALWLSDPNNWPAHGEIDVMEAVNTATVGNQMTLHTSNGCSMKSKRKETGNVLTTNCYNGTDDNAGCGVRGKPATFGEDFNNNGGGVYAMEWRDAGIRVWFFPRDSIPSDISGTPDPSTWSEPLADFPSTNCDIGTHFRNHSIIANIDFCGPWAAQDKYYTTEANCPGTCADFVAGPSSQFTNTFWEFNSFKVYSAS